MQRPLGKRGFSAALAILRDLLYCGAGAAVNDVGLAGGLGTTGGMVIVTQFEGDDSTPFRTAVIW
jgi:hypothetical protein